MLSSCSIPSHPLIIIIHPQSLLPPSSAYVAVSASSAPLNISPPYLLLQLYPYLLLSVDADSLIGLNTTRSAERRCEPGYYCAGGERALCTPGHWGLGGEVSGGCSGVCSPGEVDTHRHRQTDRDRETDRHRQTHTDTHRHAQTNTDTHRHTQTHTDKHRQT